MNKQYNKGYKDGVKQTIKMMEHSMTEYKKFVDTTIKVIESL